MDKQQLIDHSKYAVYENSCRDNKVPALTLSEWRRNGKPTFTAYCASTAHIRKRRQYH